MLQPVVDRMPDFSKENLRLVLKYAVTAVLLSLIGRSIMVGVVDGADVPKLYGQFAPTLPMLLINFTVYKYIWKQPELRLRSQIGQRWTKAYGAEFVIGHGLFTIFAVKLGVNMNAVSMAIGVLAFVASFVMNTLILGSRSRETTIVAPSPLAQ